MLKIGHLNTLRVVKKVDFGIYLDGGDCGEILLPRRYVPASCPVDSLLEVFIYIDSEDRLIATTERPHAMVGDFAALKVVAVNTVGAFLDWGLPKDLLAPYGCQKVRMQVGKTYVVRIFYDEKHKHVAASSKLGTFLPKTPPSYSIGEPVSFLLCEETDMGFKALINNTHWGLLLSSDIFTPVKLGDRIEGFIKRIQANGKIDLCIQQPGFEKIGTVADGIMKALTQHNGFLPVTDASTPAVIHATFGISKKTFKQAIGTLYKKRLITIEANGIRAQR